MKKCMECGRDYPDKVVMTFKAPKMGAAIVCPPDVDKNRGAWESRGAKLPGRKRMAIKCKQARAYDRKMKRGVA